MLYKVKDLSLDPQARPAVVAVCVILRSHDETGGRERIPVSLWANHLLYTLAKEEAYSQAKKAGTNTKAVI